jgi:hypothetical protein
MYPCRGLSFYPFCPGLRILGNNIPGVVMDGDNMFRLDQFDRSQSVVWAHREIVADRKHGQVNAFFSNQAHVAKQACVTREIKLVGLLCSE